MGDILIFLPGEREIRQAAEVLRKDHPPHTEILPLFARLSAEEQRRIFKPHVGSRIVLATNVAETSQTVPGIRYVVDSGLARVKRYSYRYKVEQLHVEKIAQASANQRAGRCGRVAAGVCIRLYDEVDYRARPPYADPEILRSSLAGVILRMKALRLGAIEDFPFLDPPPRKAIADAAHRQLADERSEFLSWLKLWDWYANELEHRKSQRKLQAACREHFFSPLRRGEWRQNQLPAAYDAIHRAVLAGLRGNIGSRAKESASCLGARHQVRQSSTSRSDDMRALKEWICEEQNCLL